MNINESPAPTPVLGKQLSSPFKLWSAAWPLYKNKLKTFILLTLLGIAAFLAALLIPIGILFAGSALFPVLKGPLSATLIIAAFLMAFYSICRFQLAFVTAIVKESCGVKEAIAASGKGVFSFFWLGLLKAFLLLGAYLLFVFPGILFTVWFCLWPFVFVTHGLKGMNCLLASKALVSGKGWGVFGRLLFSWLATILITAIPIAGPILAVFLIPFNLIYAYLIFQELSTDQSAAPPEASAGSKIAVLSTSVAGFIVIPALTVFLIFTLFKGMIAAVGMDPARIFSSKGRPSLAEKSLPPDRGSAPPTVVRTERRIYAVSSGFATQEELFTALKDAVKNRDLEKFVSCFASPGLDGGAEANLTEIAGHMFKQNVTRVWVPEKDSLAYQNLQKRYASSSANIPVEGYFRFNFENDTNKSQNFLFGRHNGRYYLAYLSDYDSVRGQKKAPESAGFVSSVVKQAKETMQSARPAPRSTKLTHELTLQNGQRLACSIVSRDAKGMWVETGPGLRSYWANGEIAGIVELDKPSEISATLASAPERTAAAPAPARAPRPLPQAEPPAAPVPGYEAHLTFARQVIEAVDQSGWNYRALGKYMCGNREDWKPMESSLETYETLGRSGGIRDYLKVEQTLCSVLLGQKTCWVNFKLLFNGLYPGGAPGSHQAANVGLNIMQAEDGSCCVNGTSLNPYST